MRARRGLGELAQPYVSQLHGDAARAVGDALDRAVAHMPLAR
jgi:hypothetical protein